MIQMIRQFTQITFYKSPATLLLSSSLHFYLIPVEPVDHPGDVQLQRVDGQRGGVDRHPQRALPRLADRPPLLVLPLLPGQVQEIRGADGSGREGVSANYKKE